MLVVIVFSVITLILGIIIDFKRREVRELQDCLDHINKLNHEYRQQAEDAQQKTRKFQKENSRLRKKLERPVDDNVDYLEQYLSTKTPGTKKVVLDAGKIEIDMPGRLEQHPEEDKS